MNIAQLAVIPTAPLSIDRAIAQLRPRSLRVHAIGPVRVNLGRMTIHKLGGPKAGTNQALGLFGFLFDRGSRGVDKDEVVEMIWPDVPIGQADSAFHRTLLGLRSTLRGAGFEAAITRVNGRYVLDSALVSWSDTSEVERLVDLSAATSDRRERVELLEACRQLNRADYMDDCPFFGTSAFVEARRRVFREVRHAVLLELAALYSTCGHRALAALRQSEARDVGGESMYAGGRDDAA